MRVSLGREESITTSLALLIGLGILALGVVGLLVPERLAVLAERLATPQGLYVAATLRVAIGLVLLRVAPASRAPLALRVLGWLAVIAGLVTPFVGVERARDMIEWWLARDSAVVRVWAAVAAAFGGFLLYAVRAGRRTG
jgi:hypothetical protein